MTHTTYTENIGSPTSWAVKQLRLNGANVCVGRSQENFGSTNVTTLSIDTGQIAPAGSHTGDGGTPTAGDVLIAAVIAKDVGQTITPPAGWTTLTAIHGVGTRNVLLSTFWKVAASGDITGTLTFHSTTTDRMVAYVSSLNQTTINTASPVLASSAVVSSADSVSINGPTTTGSGFTVVEFAAQASGTTNTSCNSTIDDSSTLLFLNSTNTGGGTGSPDFCGVTGFRYYPVVADQWHVGSAASGANWA